MADEERIGEILADVRAREERGESVDLPAILREHPDLADALGARLAALRAFDEAFSRGAPPQREIGEFRIVREIGRGGMGVVYEAEQTSMGRRVALKVLYPSITGSPRAAERFRREARAAGKLHHTNLVPVHAMGEERGVWFYAMELVAGRALDVVIDDVRRLADGRKRHDARGPTTGGFGPDSGDRANFERIASVFAGVAEALEVAHEAGVVHRDVKPSNLILDEHGTLRITDFGLARVDGDGPTMTLTGDVMGTPAYMSPEQASGDGDALDARTDVWSLGATLYETLTLRAPFRGATPQEICSRIVGRDPVRPRRVDPRIPRDLETIVLKALEKETARRYATAGEMARDLRLFAEGAAIRARRIGPFGRAWRAAKRHKAISSLAAAVVVLASGVAAFGARAAREAQAHRDIVENLSPAARVERAYGLRERGEADRALAEFDLALVAVPGSFDALFGKQRCLLDLGRPREALVVLERTVVVCPDTAKAHRECGAAYLDLGRPEEALHEADTAVAMQRDEASNYVEKWRALTALRRHQEAMETCESALRMFPGDPLAARLEVQSLRAFGKRSAARDRAASAATGTPTERRAVDFAYLCAVADRAEQAKVWLAVAEKADVDPFECARVHAVLGERDAAVRCVERAVAKRLWRPRCLGSELDFELLDDDARFRAAISLMLLPRESPEDEPPAATRPPTATFAPRSAGPTTGEWTARAPLPHPLTGVGLADVDGTLYAIGGSLGVSGSTNETSAYDPVVNAWHPRRAMPTARGEAALGVIDGRIYVVGGSVDNGLYSAALEVYDPATDSWTARRPMPAPRVGHGVGIVAGKLYVVGGCTTRNVFVATTAIYDPATDSWTDGAPMPTSRSGSGAAVLDGVLYTVGGGGLRGACGIVEAYEPATDSWSVKAPVPWASGFPAVAALGGRIWSVEGGSDDGPGARVFVYDPAADAWSEAPRARITRGGARAGVCRGTLYTVGGWCERSLADVEAFTPRARPRVASIQLTPADATVAFGAARQFVATGVFDDGSSRVLTGSDVWSEAAAMPWRRSSPSVGVHGGRVVVAGGGTESITCVRTAAMLDSIEGTWRAIAPMPTARAFTGANGASVEGRLHVIGGTIPGYATPVHESYDAVTNTWSTHAPLPTSRSALCVCAVGGRIYAVGGTDTSGSVHYQALEIYDPRTDSWSAGAAMPTARSLAGAGVVGGRIYVIGGHDNAGGGRCLAVNEAYDVGTNSWTTKAPPPYPIAPMGGVGVVDGVVYVIGGTTSSGMVNPAVLAYDSATDAWTTRASLPAPRSYGGVAVVAGVLHYCGGMDGVHPVATDLAYRPTGDVRWTSSAPDVASVDGNGLVSTFDVGSASITATTPDGVAASATLNVAPAEKPAQRPR